MRIPILLFLVLLSVPARSSADSKQVLVSPKCIECHSQATPEIVTDWKLSRHSHLQIGCDVCHGNEHTTATDFAKAKIPMPETCAMCHPSQVEQYKKGKHA